MTDPHPAGLHRLADQTFAYLQGTGATGYSNAGLVVSGDEALLVDTLYTLPQTSQMLAEMTRAVPAADICWVVNTHHDGDHWWGNQLVGDALIVSSTSAAKTMRHAGPETVAPFLSHPDARLRAILEPFDFSGITPTYPTITFEGELELTVGRRTVRVIEVGPAHTIGDVIVHVPDERVVYAGDVQVFGCHGVVHSGPIEACIRVCDTILGLDVDTVVPGHGPVGGKPEVLRVRDYLERVRDHATAAHQRGESAFEAARGFGFAEFADLGFAERVILNIGAVYRELNGDGSPGPGQLLPQMVELEESMKVQVTA